MSEPKQDVFGGTIQDESELPALEVKALEFYRQKNPKYNYLLTLSKDVEAGLHIVFVPAIRSVKTGEIQVDQEVMDLALDGGVHIQTLPSHKMETVSVRFGQPN